MWIKHINIIYVYSLVLVLSNLVLLLLVIFISLAVEPAYKGLGGTESLILTQIASNSEPIILVFIFSPIVLIFLYHKTFLNTCHAFHIISIILYLELLLFAFLIFGYSEPFLFVDYYWYTK